MRTWQAAIRHEGRTVTIGLGPELGWGSKRELCKMPIRGSACACMCVYTRVLPMWVREWERETQMAPSVILLGMCSVPVQCGVTLCPQSYTTAPLLLISASWGPGQHCHEALAVSGAFKGYSGSLTSTRWGPALSASCWKSFQAARGDIGNFKGAHGRIRKISTWTHADAYIPTIK